MKNTLKIKENSGRSMIEMLGVLAVIGVLSILYIMLTPLYSQVEVLIINLQMPIE